MIPCSAHESAEYARRAAEQQTLRLENEADTKRALEQLDKEAALAEEKALAERKRIAKRRYLLQHGVDRDQLELDLAKAQQDVIRLSAQLSLLPPLPTQ